MKGVKIWFSLVIIVVSMYIFSFSFVDQVQAVNATTITSIDKYYNIFVDYIDDKTDSIWFQRIKVKIQDRLRNSLLSGVQKKILILEWEQKIVFQSLWLKISQRNNTFKFNTNDITIQRELINAINNFRKEQWLSELSYNMILSKAAYNHANDMYMNFPYDTNGDGIKELIAHAGTNGKRVQDRVESLWYNYSLVAENIWYNQQTAEEILLARKNSPTHYANLILEKATQIGVAKLWSYWVMVIGAERKNN